MKILNILTIILVAFLSSCSTMRDSAGINRKAIDEFKVVESPPLIIPPDFNLLPPSQLKDKDISEVDKDLAKEILFGLDAQQISKNEKTSTMKQILINSEALQVAPSIREEINELFANEIKTDGILNNSWNNEIEVLDAIKESEKIRNKNFNQDILQDEDIPIKIQKIKKKRKFLFF